MKGHILFAMGAFLVALFSACTSQTSQKEGLQGTHLAQETESRNSSKKDLMKSGPRLLIKTTKEDCEIRGGEYIAHENALPQDMVDCILPASIEEIFEPLSEPPSEPPSDRRPRRPVVEIREQQRKEKIAAQPILGSAYDYLYRIGTEKPNYGLYSYVLFPVYSPRVDRFLGELFKTTSFVGLSGITVGNLNLIYLPTREDKLSSLIPMISDGSAPPVSSFATQFYDYALAEKLLAQFCTEPAEVIRNVCATDLSRGPYLFTYRHPVSTLSPVPPPYLFVDLSNVHERAFGEFIAAYKEQVKRTDYTDLERIDNLRLHLLSIVLTAADWIDPIKAGIADILHLAKGEDSRGK